MEGPYRQLSTIVRRQKGRIEITNPDGAGPLRIRILKNGECWGEGTAKHLDEAAYLVFEDMRKRAEAARPEPREVNDNF
jgi:hypothetical protein